MHTTLDAKTFAFYSPSNARDGRHHKMVQHFLSKNDYHQILKLPGLITLEKLNTMERKNNNAFHLKVNTKQALA
jgi:hypothetical protein